MKKTIETRRKEIKDLLYKLNNIELTHNIKLSPITFPEIKEFYILCQNYIKTGNNNTGSIKLVLLNRDLIYEFNNHKELNVYLKMI